MDLWLDGNYWSGYFQSSFVRQVNAFCDVITKRLLPTFEGIDKEADDIAQSEFERLGHLPASDEFNFDMGEFAEEAFEIGLDHYQAITSVKQALINLCVAALYHLLEQQILLFHRRQVLLPAEENDIKLIKIEEFRKRLKVGKLDIENLASWPKIDELRLIANSVKHAQGASSEQLKKQRPDLFIHPELDNAPATSWLATSPTVELPLWGEDLYLTATDLESYRNAVVAFWEEFGNAIRKHSDARRR